MKTVRLNKVRILILMLYLSMAIYGLINNAPTILASFDDVKYLDGEVFTPVNGEYDFKRFTLNSSQTESYRTIIMHSGFTQLVDSKENHTINVFEWNKMNYPKYQRLYPSFLLELERPYHMAEGIRIIEIDFLGDKFYGAYVNNTQDNVLIYIATPTEAETIEMIKTLEFKDKGG